MSAGPDAEAVAPRAYALVEVEVLDPVGYEPYKALAAATIAAYGGRYLARGGAAERLEGAGAPHRLVVLEFPSLERLRAWYASPEYAPALAIRLRTARSRFEIVEGVEKMVGVAP